MLQPGQGAEAARLFWAIDHRNPLSPPGGTWLRAQSSWGLTPACWRCATPLPPCWPLPPTCLVITVGGRPARSFALGIAIVSVFWMANRYTEQIIWNFQGALVRLAALRGLLCALRRGGPAKLSPLCDFYPPVVRRVRDLLSSMWRCSRHQGTSRSACPHPVSTRCIPPSSARAPPFSTPFHILCCSRCFS